MGHLFNHHHWLPSNGLNRALIRPLIRLKDLCQEGLQIRYLMHLVNCLVPRILQIRRVNIPSQGASTATPSTQRPNHLFLVMVAFHFPSRCRIMALLIMGLRTTALPISHIMPFLRLNNSTTTVWDTIWLDRVLTILCHLIMHRLIWLIGR
jgi:hypothetical protein